MRVGTWPEVALYNSILTAHNEDEGRQIANEERSAPSRNTISMLLFAFYLGRAADGRIAEIDRASVALRTCRQTSGRTFRVDSHANDSTVIARFTKSRREKWKVRHVRNFSEYVIYDL